MGTFPAVAAFAVVTAQAQEHLHGLAVALQGMDLALILKGSVGVTVSASAF